jgi:hypothetical protein
MILDPSKLTKMGTILVLQKSVPGHIMPGVVIFCSPWHLSSLYFSLINIMKIRSSYQQGVMMQNPR